MTALVLMIINVVLLLLSLSALQQNQLPLRDKYKSWLLNLDLAPKSCTTEWKQHGCKWASPSQGDHGSQVGHIFLKIGGISQSFLCSFPLLTGPVQGHKCFGRYSVSLACPHTHALSCCRTSARYIIQGGLLSASDQQQARRLSKAVLSRSRLKLPEPADYLPATGICLPWPIFACLCHRRLPSLQENALCAVNYCQGQDQEVHSLSRSSLC